jgi:hypothetical protein
MNNIDEMFNNVGLHKYKLFIQSYPMSFIFHFNLKQLILGLKLYNAFNMLWTQHDSNFTLL